MMKSSPSPAVLLLITHDCNDIERDPHGAQCHIRIPGQHPGHDNDDLKGPPCDDKDSQHAWDSRFITIYIQDCIINLIFG